MEVLEAMEIVYELADDNKLSPREADTEDLLREAVRQREALDVVHDHIVNVISEE